MHEETDLQKAEWVTATYTKFVQKLSNVPEEWRMVLDDEMVELILIGREDKAVRKRLEHFVNNMF